MQVYWENEILKIRKITHATNKIMYVSITQKSTTINTILFASLKIFVLSVQLKFSTTAPKQLTTMGKNFGNLFLAHCKQCWDNNF